MKIAASPRASAGLTRHKPSHTGYEAPEQPRVFLPAVIPTNRPEHTSRPSLNTRPTAALLAQILAGTEDLPGARAKRRIDPAEGLQIYRSIAGLGMAAPSRDGSKI